ncbi:cysteine methyltransferase [Candidatus Acetothermia bacterium]|nr:MAG: cysteine methyltransferase [Candidatus Acetothermia bacterium]
MSAEPVYADSVRFENWQFTVMSSRAGVRLIDLHGMSPAVLASRLKARLARGGNRDAVAQLFEYFSGFRRQFDLPLDLRGTAFQLAVWEKLLGVPYGETISYGELALEIGKPTAARAVGAAVGANPIPIIVPCHRVIGKTGGLVGFGGGLDLKRRLLALEGVILD